MAMALQVLQAKTMFLSKSPVIGLKSSPTELKFYLTEADEKIAEFQGIYNCFVTKTESPNAHLMTLIEKSEAEILLSFCKPEIQITIGKENFSSAKKVDELKLALKNIIGEEDPRVQSAQLKKDFCEMGRRTQLNEKFDCFIDRLVAKAGAITETNYKIEMAVDQFQKCLRPMDWDVIHLFPDQCTGTGIDLIREQAKLLDDRKFFSKVEAKSHKVEIEDIRLKLESKVDKLTNQLSAQAIQISEQAKAEREFREDQMKLSKALLDRFDKQFSAQSSLYTHLVKSTGETASTPIKTPPLPVNEPNSQPENRNGNGKISDSRRAWIDKRNFCHFCGGRRCKKADKCTGNPKLFCCLCEIAGHCPTSMHFHGIAKNL